MKKSIITSFSFFILFVLFVSSISTVRAATTLELQAQIRLLQQQLQSLQSQVNGNVPTISSVPTITVDLSLGSTGSAVRDLQRTLNFLGIKVSVSGAGSPGQESNYYGQKTANAVKRFQDQYSSTILAPLGLTHGTGYFGVSTRAMMNSLIASKGIIQSGSSIKTTHSNSDESLGATHTTRTETEDIDSSLENNTEQNGSFNTSQNFSDQNIQESASLIPVIDSISPTKTNTYGDKITLTGKHFDSTDTEVIVSYNLQPIVSVAIKNDNTITFPFDSEIIQKLNMKLGKLSSSGQSKVKEQLPSQLPFSIVVHTPEGNSNPVDFYYTVK